MRSSLVPESKSDLAAVRRANDAGYPAVQPVLGELLAWLQDYNWPVARELAPFLADVGLPLVPHIDQVLASDDETWKYWIIVCLIGNNQQLLTHYRQRLIQWAENPTDNERHHELDEVAREALAQSKRGSSS